MLQREYSLRTHLIAFALATVLPMALLAGLLLFRSANLERDRLETRLLQVADDLADDVDRHVVQQFAVLRTLAALPSLAAEDWPTFYVQAKGAIGETAYVMVLDTSLRQLVNTLHPYGQAPAVAGDPETARRVIGRKEPAVSDLFLSPIDRTPVFNLSIPIVREKEVRYVVIFGQQTAALCAILEGQKLGAEWTTAILDRKGAVLVRSRDHAKYAGTAPGSFASDLAVTDQSVLRNVSLDGEPVLQAVVRLKNGWLAVADIPIAIAEGPLRRSLWLWALLSFSALVLAATLALALARSMSRPIATATDAAAALGGGEAVCAETSSLLEANTLVNALQNASHELSERAEHQRLLLNELSHRVKNLLTVVQAIIARTLSDERTMHDGRRILSERVLALARAHDLLMRTDWKGVSIKDIIRAELEPFSNRVSLEGPDLTVEGKLVQTFALVIHELATNAAKHGALSNDTGRLLLRWSVDGSGEDARFKFRWEETGGPPVLPPTRKGFGSTLLETAITSDLENRPRLSFEADGFVYELDVPLGAVRGS